MERVNTKMLSIPLLTTKPFDTHAATVGNGTMIGLKADSREHLDAVYNKAIKLGAQDEGAAFSPDGILKCSPNRKFFLPRQSANG